MPTIKNIKTHFFQPGKIEWIGLRLASNSEIIQVDTAELLANHGLVGDKSAQIPGSKRQVSLIQAEYFAVMESLLNKNKIFPQTLRRNIVISGLNLSVLSKQCLKINSAVLEITGNCAPCAKMEQALGYGGFNAMRNHGGINAVVKKGGVIRIGDEVEVCVEAETKELPQQALI